MQTTKPKSRNRLGCYWGLTFLGLHLLAIACGIIDPLGSAATGTVTVHGWFLAWLISYNLHGGLDCPYALFEAALLLPALFQLAVGAAAFSRVYYGPLFGHERDLFQELTVVGIEEAQRGGNKAIIPPWMAERMIESVRRRFTGAGWWACEFADVVAHQGPFALMCRLLSRERRGWSRVAASVGRSWHASMLVGTLHRLVWDFCTCGESFCDGPYRGFLLIIRKREQFLWHLLPCVAIVMFLTRSNFMKDRSSLWPGRERREKVE